MKKPKVPLHWYHLYPGEQFHTRLPFHRLEAIAAELPDRKFQFIPSPSGYFVKREPVETEFTLRIVK